jgi:hypothetical protein
LIGVEVDMSLLRQDLPAGRFYTIKVPSQYLDSLPGVKEFHRVADEILPRYGYSLYEGIRNQLMGYVEMPAKSPRNAEKVKGQFLSQDLDKEKLEKAKKTAKTIVKRNKRLGDLLGQ